jgi:hypothetical protein
MIRPMLDNPYRATVPPENDSYLVAWSDLKRRRQWLSASLVILGMTIFLLANATNRLGPLAVFVMAFATIIASNHCERFRCPRCSAPFCRKGLFHNAFAHGCLHCHIKVDSPKDP